MKISFYNISIRNKLIIAIQSVTFAVLIVSFFSYFIFTSQRDKENLLNRMEITAKLVGEYAVSPLVFGDDLGGKDIISRLSSMPEIQQAFIIDDAGNIFSSYGNPTLDKNISLDLTLNQQASDFSIWEDDYFQISKPIIYNEEYYGKITMIIGLKPFKDKLINDLEVMSINMLLIFAFSWVLSVFIQQYISKPIKKLVNTTNKIVSDGDYSLRVHSQGNDEIGQLYVSYNKMLERITLEQSQQQKYSEALELSEVNYRSIFENSIVGIFKIDIKTGSLIQANDRFYEILQLDKFKIDSYSIHQFLSRKERITFLQSIKRDGQIENFEIQYKGNIWISFSGKEASKNYIDGVIQDITERKQTFIELNKVNFELDNFVYHASHDLRSPLRSILGLTNLLKYGKIDEGDLSIINKIESSISRLDLLVTDLLTFSKNSRTNTENEPIDFHTLLNECLDSIPHDYTKNVSVSIDIKQEEEFLGDRTRISVIINNLLVNAHKYQIVENKHKKVSVNLIIDGQWLTIKIEDNGEGIDTSNHEHIFDMFYRASESSDGSGLGLYIVKNVVATLKGEIKLESKLNHGTTFEIRLPNKLTK